MNFFFLSKCFSRGAFHRVITTIYVAGVNNPKHTYSFQKLEFQAAVFCENWQSKSKFVFKRDQFTFQSTKWAEIGSALAKQNHFCSSCVFEWGASQL